MASVRPPARSREQVRDQDARFLPGKRRDRLAGLQDSRGRVPEAIGLRPVGDGTTVDLELAVAEVRDPVVEDAGAGVKAALANAVIRQRGFAHLDDEERSLG